MLLYHLGQDCPEGVETGLVSSGPERRDLSAIEVAAGFVLTIAGGVTSKLVAAWLYDKLKAGGTTRLEIEREETEITEEGIRRSIERIRIQR